MGGARAAPNGLVLLLDRQSELFRMFSVGGEATIPSWSVVVERHAAADDLR